MAERFAIKNGNWSDVTTWDNGALPTADDSVYANTFNVTIDQPITVSKISVRNSQVIMPDNLVTVFTSSIDAAPYVSSSGAGVTYPEWYATDNIGTTTWQSDKVVTGNTVWLGYTFDSPITIKQYAVYRTEFNYGIRGWIFQGSTDAATWVDLQTVTNNTTARYVSGILANTTAYRYYRLLITATGNNSAYAPRVYSFEMTDSTEPQGGQLAGGSFKITGSTDITFTGVGLEYTNVSHVLLDITSPSGSIINFDTSGSGAIHTENAQLGNGDPIPVQIKTPCTINIDGDLNGPVVTSYSSRTGIFYITAGATLNINGNIYAPNGVYGGNICPFIRVAAENVYINVTGNVYGATQNLYGYPIYCAAGSMILNITGNIYGQLGAAIYNTRPGEINHVGVIQTTTINGSPGIVSLNGSSIVKSSTPFINYNGINAVAAYGIKFYSGSAVEWQVQDSENNNFNIYSSNVTGSTLGLPLTTNVRNGITFGPDGDLTGTLIVPSADNVRKGVAVDNTTGTAELTAEDFLTAISSSTNPVAIRLKNVATVQSVGEQFNVFNP